VAAREHRAGAWAAFLAVAASVAFLPVMLSMTFGAVRAVNQPTELSISTLAADPQIADGSFGVSGWMRSRGLGIATTSLSLIGALAVFAALRPFLHVVSTP
jgi:hypothetical protein